MPSKKFSWSNCLSRKCLLTLDKNSALSPDRQGLFLGKKPGCIIQNMRRRIDGPQEGAVVRKPALVRRQNILEPQTNYVIVIAWTDSKFSVLIFAPTQYFFLLIFFTRTGSAFDLAKDFRGEVARASLSLMLFATKTWLPWMIFFKMLLHRSRPTPKFSTWSKSGIILSTEKFTSRE